MTSQSYYHILGVSSSATAEEIRRAYLVRSKMFHPDRFNRTSQTKEWHTANEMLKELNEAYHILRDPGSRSAYDSNNSSTSVKEENQESYAKPRPESPPKRPPSDINLGRLVPGFAQYSSLPKGVQDRIGQRIQRRDAQQFITSIRGVIWNYLYLVLLTGWFYPLFLFASDSSLRTQERLLWLGGITLVVALLIGVNTSWIVRWHRSPLKTFFIVTPLYFIKTYLNDIWFWPLWDLKDARATHNFRNGVYLGTDVNMLFSTGWESLRFSDQAAYDSMLSAARDFNAKLRSANELGQRDYFLHEDDFREVDVSKDEVAREGLSTTTVLACLISVLVSGGIFAIAYGVNSAQLPRTAPPRYSTPSIRSSPSAPRAIAASTPAFAEPALPLPRSGEVRRYTTSKGVAPFQIRSSPGSHYLVKLDDVSTRRVALSVFVRGGETEEIHVPLGTYVVKYASGNEWYGYQHLFGPSTQYSKAYRDFSFTFDGNQYSGYSVTLYQVRDGNLRTSRISANEF